MLIQEAVAVFLRKMPHNNPDLISWWSTDLETQINVSPLNGHPVEESRNTWTDGKQTWSHIRWPRNAMAEPYYRDRPITFSLVEHVEYIGSTGWCWVNRESWHVAFDFDDVTSHAAGVGVDEQQLEQVREKAIELPYVDVIRSTGGKGLHLYIRFDHNNAPKTRNHTEHAALARALLGKMSTDVGFDFGSHLDVCGSNIWIWGKKMTPENQGYASIKKAQYPLSADTIPSNWKDHLDVISNKTSKVRVIGFTENKQVDEQDELTELTSARVKYKVTDAHKTIINNLEQTGYTNIWVPDHHLLQTHTRALQQVFEQGNVKGYFDTLSRGTEPTKPNSFCIPGPKGSFTVYRFGKGTPEHRLWNQDNKGWTWIKYNTQPNLRTAALAMGGKEEEKGGYIFDNTEKVKQTVEAIGSKLLLPEGNDYTDRETKIGKHKDGRLIVEIEKKDGDRGFDDDWLEKRGGKWFRIYNINTNLVEEERDYAEYDSLIRSIRTPSNVAAGWTIRAGGVWVRSPREDVKDVLKAYNQMVDTTLVMGQAILNQWTLVNLPFQDELPGGRQWNYGAAQFKYKPAELDVDEQPSHPHWDLILSHLGTDLDQCIRETAWCKKWNINSGKDYLTAWIACSFREPFEPLPYLFFYGDYECGKSTLHEALALLVTSGIVKADTAIVNQGDFNGELANGVLAIIDEKNIAAAGPQVYNKLKEWCTGLTISIHRKRTEVYEQPNTLHFLQFANDKDACPVFPGDTRIVVIKVGPLIEEIPKRLLMKKLKEEAEHFMATLMSVPLPESLTRLRLPIIETETKRNAMILHRNPLEIFIDEQCFHKLGRFVTMKDFYERFSAALNPYEKQAWTKSKIRRNMPDIYPIGRYSGNSLSVGNLSFDNVEVPDEGPYFINQSNKLKLVVYGTEAENVQNNNI